MAAATVETALRAQDTGTPAAEEKIKAMTEEKERQAQSQAVGDMLFYIAVTMVVPTRAPMVLQIKRGDVAGTAKAMGLMSTCAAIVELVVNPILGKLSDEHGRKPFMIMALAVDALVHSLVAAAPMSLPMQFLDRMISGSMIFAYASPSRAALADLFGDDPMKLATWQARRGFYTGLGTTLGPLIGSKIGGARSFFASAVAFIVAMCFVQLNVTETLTEAKKKKFKISDINPFAFLKLFREKTLGMMSLTVLLQSFGDFVNVYDINNLFMLKVLKYNTEQVGKFAVAVGITQILGGGFDSMLVGKMGLEKALLFANTMWAIGMSTLGTARSTAQAFLALALWTFGHQRANTPIVYAFKAGDQMGLGRGEIISAQQNLMAWVKVFIPLLYSNMFAWATSNGRDIPGLPYFTISVLTGLAQMVFMSARPKV